MVNKQYNVQSLGKNKTKNSNNIDAQTLKQTITVIPNETINVNSSNGANDSYQSQQNAFERNITQQFYYSITDSLDGHFDNKHIGGDDSMGDIVKNSNSTGATDADSQSQKHLSINDIGRFQYILQMDREMVRLFFLFQFFFSSSFTLIQARQQNAVKAQTNKPPEKKWEADFFHYVIISRC